MKLKLIFPSLGRLAATAVLALALTAPADARERAWVGAWAASQQVPEPRNTLPAGALTDATVRQIMRVTAGGPQIRIRLSNAFGTAPLRFSAVHVARPSAPGSAAIAPGGHAVTFNGQPGVTVPAGAEYVSDPVGFVVKPLESVAISFHLPEAPTVQTGHPGSRTTTFYAHGQHVAAADLPGAEKVVRWYQVSGIDVPAAPKSAAIVVFGDSITDGFGVGPDRNDRWPDALAERLQAAPATRHLSVLNQGIGGNRLLNDSLGPNALARFERDVLGQTGVRYVIILEGVNDLGTSTQDAPISPEAHARLTADMLGAYRQMVARGRARGLKVIGATILPFAGSFYKPTAANEADRQTLNAWIRAPGNFDAVIDFDAVMRDPAQPDRMKASVDSGDHLHPSLAGYRAMAAAVPLSLFKP
ncbi:SGNH/GDSL hydrolase family protein [Phenylobacterium sp.]|uniref:SGNH/GDSL hydrolase family protein n=1 Tax=Phenylobacterium sp. TaxID=1871053 RepID=UPI0025D73470|nr:SGNH/GDSL hydrolase family protein [Phenylobacterium sp.]